MTNLETASAASQRVLDYLRKSGFPVLSSQVSAQLGSRRFDVDVVAYADADRLQPVIVAEVKPSIVGEIGLLSPVVQRAVEAASALGPTVRYLLISDGQAHHWFERHAESRTVEPLRAPPRRAVTAPAYGQTLIPIEGVDHLVDLLSVVTQLLRADSQAASAQVIVEVLRLLVAKCRHELSSGESGASAFASTAAADPGRVAERVRAIFQEAVADAGVIGQPGTTWSTSDAALAAAAEKIAPFALLSAPAGSLDFAFWRVFRSLLKTSGGQYLTPPPVAELAARLVRPAPGERIVDPTCGTGSMLMEAERQADIWLAETDPSRRAVESGPRTQLFGFEANATVAEIARLNLLLAGHPIGGISAMDVLSSTSFADREGRTPDFDVAVLNPPFGVVKNSGVAATWSEIWHQSGRKDRSALFLERAVSLVRPGGRIAIVLPDGFLSLPTLEHARHWLLERTAVRAIISLPPETFAPLGTNVKTSVLLLEKLAPEAGSRVFLAELREIGYDRLGRTISDSGVAKLVAEFTRFISTAGRIHVESPELTVRSIDAERLSAGRLDVPYLYGIADESTHLLESVAFPSVELKELVQIVSGQHMRPESEEYGDTEVVLLQAGAVREFVLDLSKAASIRVNDLNQRARVKDGDVLVTTTGFYLGRAAVTENLGHPAIASSSVTILRPGPEVRPHYLAAILNSTIGQTQVAALQASSTAQPYLRRSDLGRVLIPLPPLAVQDRVARRVLTLRSKAEKLRNQAGSLEAEAAALVIQALRMGDYA